MFVGEYSELGDLGKLKIKKVVKAIAAPVKAVVKPVTKYVTKPITKAIPKPIRRIGKAIAAPTGIPLLARQKKLIQQKAQTKKEQQNIPVDNVQSTPTQVQETAAQVFREQGVQADQAAAQASTMAQGQAPITPAVANALPEQPVSIQPQPRASSGGSGGGGSSDGGGSASEDVPPDELKPENSPEQPTQASMFGGSTGLFVIGGLVVAALFFGKNKKRR